MLTEGDLPLRYVNGRVFFDFLGPQDEPWLRVILDEMSRFEGRRRREIAERLAEPLPCEAPHFKRRAATRVLLALWKRERVAAVPPVQARARLFEGAAADPCPPEQVRARVAAELGVSAEALAQSLFADLPGERVVRAPEPPPSPAEIALRTNLAVAQAVLMRAATVDLKVEGGVRPIVRLAKLRGLLCTVAAPSPDPHPSGGGDAHAHAGAVSHSHAGADTNADLDRDSAPGTLSISGPFALFRHTLLYGRALAELLPHLAWCARYRLHASTVLRGRTWVVELDSDAPLFPAAAPAAFDSRVEERFARDVRKLAPDWDVIREPQPLPAAGTLIFPDFLLRHRIHPQRRVLVEIVGFWTPDYLTKKLERLRQADLGPFILCIDDDRACDVADLPANASVVRFRRRLDAAAVLRRVFEMFAATSQDTPSLTDGSPGCRS